MKWTEHIKSGDCKTNHSFVTENMKLKALLAVIVKGKWLPLKRTQLSQVLPNRTQSPCPLNFFSFFSVPLCLLCQITASGMSRSSERPALPRHTVQSRCDAKSGSDCRSSNGVLVKASQSLSKSSSSSSSSTPSRFRMPNFEDYQKQKRGSVNLKDLIDAGTFVITQAHVNGATKQQSFEVPFPDHGRPLVGKYRRIADYRERKPEIKKLSYVVLGVQDRPQGETEDRLCVYVGKIMMIFRDKYDLGVWIRVKYYGKEFNGSYKKPFNPTCEQNFPIDVPGLVSPFLIHWDSGNKMILTGQKKLTNQCLKIIGVDSRLRNAWIPEYHAARAAAHLPQGLLNITDVSAEQREESQK